MKAMIDKWLDYKAGIWLMYAIAGRRLNWFQKWVVSRNNGWKIK